MNDEIKMLIKHIKNGRILIEQGKRLKNKTNENIKQLENIEKRVKNRINNLRQKLNKRKEQPSTSGRK